MDYVIIQPNGYYDVTPRVKNMIDGKEAFPDSIYYAVKEQITEACHQAYMRDWKVCEGILKSEEHFNPYAIVKSTVNEYSSLAAKKIREDFSMLAIPWCNELADSVNKELQQDICGSYYMGEKA